MSYPILKSGYDKLVAELEALKSHRQVLSKAIGTAREHGDLRENAEYHAAKEQQGMEEAKISQLEGKIANSSIIDPSKNGKDKVYFGSTFVVFEIATEKELTFTIVSEDEVDLTKGMISNQSPLGRAFLAKSVGDLVSIQTPNAIREFEVASIN